MTMTYDGIPIISEQRLSSPHHDITGHIKVIEQVFDRATGLWAEREEDAPIFAGYDGPHIYHWEEGNMECDCNRAMVHGIESECNGEDRRFLLNLLRASDRAVLYSEFPRPADA